MRGSGRAGVIGDCWRRKSGGSEKGKDRGREMMVGEMTEVAGYEKKEYFCGVN